MIDDKLIPGFRKTVWQYYRTAGRRDLPWRQPGPDGRLDPYKILVSEVMLQQTQVGRIIPKYGEFLQRFPTLESLAAAPPAGVLRAWSGLGYNRRAKFLHQAAQLITHKYRGVIPENTAELAKLPGIGPNTAAAIAVYAFDRPAVFVETNIRTVFIHHFFRDQTAVADRAILALAERTLDVRRPREWYWALMDYGSYLKQRVGNLNRRSRTYAKQSKFEGSRRQLRGRIIRLLTIAARTESELQSHINDQRLPAVLQELQAENLIVKRGKRFSL